MKFSFLVLGFSLLFIPLVKADDAMLIAEELLLHPEQEAHEPEALVQTAVSAEENEPEAAAPTGPATDSLEYEMQTIELLADAPTQEKNEAELAKR
jgi:hypothetical protein